MVTVQALCVGATLAVTIFAGVVLCVSPKVEDKVEAGMAVVACLTLAYILIGRG